MRNNFPSRKDGSYVSCMVKIPNRVQTNHLPFSQRVSAIRLVSYYKNVALLSLLYIFTVTKWWKADRNMSCTECFNSCCSSEMATARKEIRAAPEYPRARAFHIRIINNPLTVFFFFLQKKC